MNKYEILKATHELKNAFYAILYHQFNLIKIDSNHFQDFNFNELKKFLQENEFPIYTGFIVEEETKREILICEEINKEKFCLESLNKINNKMTFSIKSANDFIEMLYFELKQKITPEIKTYTTINNYQDILLTINEDDKIIVIINEKKLESKIFIKNIFNDNYIEIVTINLFKDSQKYFCFMNIEINKLINYLVEKEV